MPSKHNLLTTSTGFPSCAIFVRSVGTRQSPTGTDATPMDMPVPVSLCHYPKGANTLYANSVGIPPHGSSAPDVQVTQSGLGAVAVDSVAVADLAVERRAIVGQGWHHTVGRDAAVDIGGRLSGFRTRKEQLGRCSMMSRRCRCCCGTCASSRAWASVVVCTVVGTPAVRQLCTRGTSSMGRVPSGEMGVCARAGVIGRGGVDDVSVADPAFEPNSVHVHRAITVLVYGFDFGTAIAKMIRWIRQLKCPPFGCRAVGRGLDESWAAGCC